MDGAVWLSADKTSHAEFYQALMNTSDEQVPRFLRMLTFLPLDEIKAIEKDMSAPGYVSNTAQKRLAEEVMRFVRGEEALAQAGEAPAPAPQEPPPSSGGRSLLGTTVSKLAPILSLLL